MDFNTQRCEYHQQALSLACGVQARQYLLSRGISDKTIEEFKLGWCPTDWVGHQIWCRRVIFPLIDAYGKVIGFSGRLLTHKCTDEQGTQYIVENETNRIIKATYVNGYKQQHDLIQYHDSFMKQYFLFGMHQAKKNILEKNYAIVVEGQSDCLSMHSAGFTNTVATMGSSLTLFHLISLCRYCDFIIFIFDADDGGRKALKLAVERSIISYGFINLPDQSDPNDFILTYGPEAMSKLIEEVMSSKQRGFLEAKTEYTKIVTNALNNSSKSVVNEIEHELSVSGKYEDDFFDE